MDRISKTLASLAAIQGFVSIEDFGASQDKKDNTEAIRSALNSGERRLYVPPGTYNHAGELYLKSNVEFFGVRGLSHLHATDQVNTSLYIRDAVNVNVHDLKLTSSATIRKQGMVSHKVSVVRSEMCFIENLDIDGSSAAGILMSESKRVWVEKNRIKNTLADGIHVTRNSSDIFINRNWLSNTGDDGISVVSYRADSTNHESFTITVQSGVSASGELHVVLDGLVYRVGVSVGDSSSIVAGKMRAGTFPEWLITGTDNTVIFTATGNKLNKNDAWYNPNGTGVECKITTSSQGDGLCTNIQVIGNQVYNSFARGMTHIGGGGVNFESNIVDGSASSAFLIMLDNSYATHEPYDTIVSNNIARNAGKVDNQVGNQYGFEIQTSTKRLSLKGNTAEYCKGRGYSITGNGHIVEGNRAYRNYQAGFETSGNFINFSGNYAEENGQQGFVFTNCADVIVGGSNTALNNNTRAIPGVDNWYFSNCSKFGMSNNSSIDTRSPGLIHRTYEFNNCRDFKISNHCQDAVSLITGFSGSNSGILFSDGLTGTVVPSVTIYADGQDYYKTDTSELFKYSGSAGWKKVGVIS